jgi:hypothetical protein
MKIAYLLHSLLKAIHEWIACGRGPFQRMPRFCRGSASEISKGDTANIYTNGHSEKSSGTSSRRRSRSGIAS